MRKATIRTRAGDFEFDGHAGIYPDDDMRALLSPLVRDGIARAMLTRSENPLQHIPDLLVYKARFVAQAVNGEVVAIDPLPDDPEGTIY